MKTSPKDTDQTTRSSGASRVVRTSATDPINVNWLPDQAAQGKVGITFAPGKHVLSSEGAFWERDLAADLDRLRQVHGVDVLVCLLPDHELRRLKIPTLVQDAEARGIHVRRLPIEDGGTPPRKADVDSVVDDIRTDVAAGKRVAIHCQGGLGRAGTIGGCYLRAAGMGTDETLKVLVQARGRRCPENDLQKSFVRNFR